MHSIFQKEKEIILKKSYFFAQNFKVKNSYSNKIENPFYKHYEIKANFIK